MCDGYGLKTSATIGLNRLSALSALGTVSKPLSTTPTVSSLNRLSALSALGTSRVECGFDDADRVSIAFRL